jgi:soluble lytic murein transglycosylase-like protein
MKTCRNIGFVALLLALACHSSPAAELANLQNGFAVRHERREVIGAMTRLYLTGAPDNYVDVPTDDIVGFEKVDTPPRPVTRSVSAPTPTLAPTPTIDEVISAASSRNRLDADLINSVIRAESGFNAKAVSPRGAQGLMQLMPRTAAQLGVRDAMDPASNVEAGTRYLRELLLRYDNDLIKALAAYNAGPDRVLRYNGVPPYPETIAYVARVIRDFNRKKLAQRSLQSNPDSKRKMSQGSKTTAGQAQVLPAAGSSGASGL